MRMPRMQVYLPEALCREVKARGLPASELLQEAIAAEVRRQELASRADDYLTELLAEVGEPSEAEADRADVIARRIRERVMAGRHD